MNMRVQSHCEYVGVTVGSGKGSEHVYICRFLAGDGARKWALKRGLNAAESQAQADQVRRPETNVKNYLAMDGNIVTMRL